MFPGGVLLGWLSAAPAVGPPWQSCVSQCVCDSDACVILMSGSVCDSDVCDSDEWFSV